MKTAEVADGLDRIQAEVDAHAHGRVPRELRRRQILAVAERLFEQQGYAATSMEELASASGVTKPVVYDLVGGKEKVFEACMAAAADALAERVATAVAAVTTDDHEARLRAGARAWFDFVADRRPLWDALLAGGDAPVSAAVEAIRERQDAFVAAQLVSSAREEGRAIAPDTAEALATAMNGAFEALGRWWGSHPDRSAAELAELYTDLVLPGLRHLLELGRAEPSRR